MRLNKYIAAAGVTARRKADEMIAAGRVKVNGQAITTLGADVGSNDLVAIDNRVVEPPGEIVVYLLHKPAGTISSVSDPQGRPTVVDLIAGKGAGGSMSAKSAAGRLRAIGERRPRPGPSAQRGAPRIYPVGRLDWDTTGALLLTNDGELANLLTHPRYGVEKHYLVEVEGRLTSREIAALSGGIAAPGGRRLQARVAAVPGKGRRTTYKLVLTEGKNRQIKHIFAHFGLPVLRLHRTLFAGLTTDALKPGSFRRLKRVEVERLYALARSPH